MQNRHLPGVVGVSLAALLCATAAPPAAAQRNRVTIPSNTVIRAELTQDINSRNARRGDRVLARLDNDEDTSGFPEGTRFEGTITEVERARDNRPATIDMRFDRAILPGGNSVAIRGELASLADDDLRRTADGRLESRRGGGGSSFDWKWVGYGAAGGAVLGQIFGGELLKGGLLGGLGGAIYSYLNRDNDRDRDFRDIELSSGTDFGLVLNQSVAFNPHSDWRYGRGYNSRVAGRQDEYRFGGDTNVFVNGQRVRFQTDQPTTVNGVAYVPLRPIAEAAGWRLDHRYGVDGFTLDTGSGWVRGNIGDNVIDRGGRRYPLTHSPMMMRGQLYVPLEWLSTSTGTEVEWNRNGRRLNINTNR